MENSLKGLLLAAGTVITCVVITLGFYLSSQAQATASTGTSQIGKINSEFADSDKMMYDGKKVSGNEVINAIHKFEGQQIAVKVKNHNCTTCYGYNLDAKNEMLLGENGVQYASNMSIDDDMYINPYASFNGNVIRNRNNVIIAIEFEQS